MSSKGSTVSQPMAYSQPTAKPLQADESQFLGRKGKLELEGNQPRRIDEADDIGIESTIDGVQDSHFTQSLHCKQQHDTDNQIADDLNADSSVPGPWQMTLRGQQTKEAGPPLWRAPPEPMKRPAPIAPPMLER